METVWVESYIFEPGLLSERLLKCLKTCKDRGVDVRIMVDGIGAPDFIDNFGDSLREQGIPFKIYHPVPWIGSQLHESEAWLPSRILALWGNLNSRNHRKTFIIDGSIAYIGSMNVSDNHLTEVYGSKAWFDVGVKVEGGCVEILKVAYINSWDGWREKVKAVKWSNIKKSISNGKFQRFFILNHTLRTRKLAFARLRLRIARARQKVWIVTPYFSPGFRFVRRLRMVARRGVDVRLLFPKHNDILVMDWVVKSYYGELLKAGIRIYEYEPSVLHAKAAIIDDWAMVGSSNLNSRSIVHDLELNYILQMRSTYDQLTTVFRDSFEKSVEVKSADYVNVFQRFFGRLFLLLRYFL